MFQLSNKSVFDQQNRTIYGRQPRYHCIDTSLKLKHLIISKTTIFSNLHYLNHFVHFSRLLFYFSSQKYCSRCNSLHTKKYIYQLLNRLTNFKSNQKKKAILIQFYKLKNILICPFTTFAHV